ncbi:hypothetical protein K5X82_00805 [Halosquirtibacter xylanolyticus]|uniref:hypothetical protein n=1 Tax=Halosquirtibacter xylanolyticus TaxID=3374599 RepID=UPI0037499307|nr:hypothetical protein K5X82_00805 [Prolixibacteraceae bacterium]
MKRSAIIIGVGSMFILTFTILRLHYGVDKEPQFVSWLGWIGNIITIGGLATVIHTMRSQKKR